MKILSGFNKAKRMVFLSGMEDMARGAQELDNIIKQGYLEKKSKGMNQLH